MNLQEVQREAWKTGSREAVPWENFLSSMFKHFGAKYFDVSCDPQQSNS